MKKGLGAVAQWFVNLSLRTKLMIFFPLVLGVTMLAAFSVAFSYVADGYNEMMIRSLQLSYSQAHEFISQSLWPLIDTSDVIFYNSSVQSILRKSKAQRHLSLGEQYRDMFQMQDVLKYQGSSGQVVQARLYLDGWLVYAQQDVYFSDLASLGEDRLELLRESRNNTAWLAPEAMVLFPNEQPTRVVSLLRAIKNSEDFTETVGVMRISMRADRLDEILFNADITEVGVAFLINSRREVIASSGGDVIEELELASAEGYAALTEAPIVWERMEVGGETSLVNVQAVDQSDWHLVAIVPVAEISSPVTRTAIIFVLVTALALAVFMVCAFLFSGWFTRRMRVLAKQMVLARQGDYDIKIENADTDEVGMLYDSFNYMLEEMRHNTRQQYEDGKAIKNAELKALQAQINPHFLYNTLDLLNWKAMQRGADEVADIAQTLAKFYRLSLKSGSDIVTLADELEHVDTYVKIQDYRFDNKLSLNIQVPGELMDYPMPKILLQPLVENAILHGIRKNPQLQKGRIEISAAVVGGQVLIRVTDNGIGMSRAQIEQLTQGGAGAAGSYGVRNINLRMQLVYGDACGLYYESVMGVGTTVTLRCPAGGLGGPGE